MSGRSELLYTTFSLIFMVTAFVILINRSTKYSVKIVISACLHQLAEIVLSYLTVSYEVPGILAPLATALQPLLESLLRGGLERFATLAKSTLAD
ncbi:hypothetical protein NC653_033169 [Populus alba x Populus x berolinensis]|uniref:Uncharacterized protein n=1 Tax=Populus alba x Populus x berolinensis TaxID=444605 RepID=A0AAD6PYT4_9ROSI|nr:hypothetical protein NC653_033169 [Populus alba x Populus x berolinensis]